MKELFIRIVVSIIIILSIKCRVQEMSDKENLIYLLDVRTSNYRGFNLTDSLAKEILYSFFENKGYYTSSNLPPIVEFMNSYEEGKSRQCVDYNSVYLFELNGNEYFDGIVTYWLIDPYENGSHLQPYKAIIVDSDSGYIVNNENFLGPNWIIDSVFSHKNEKFLIAREYNLKDKAVSKSRKFKLSISD